MNLKQWQDRYGFIHVNKNPEPMDSENGVLFTAYVTILDDLHNHEVKPVNLFSLWHKGKWRGSAYGEGDHFSHDNYLGMLWFNRRGLHTKFYDFITYGHWHPRDIIMFNYARGHLWLFPLLIIPIIAIIVSAFMASPDRTSGALLSRLRCRLLNFKWLEKIVTKIINKKVGSWHEVYKIYFRNEGHPCRELSKVMSTDAR